MAPDATPLTFIDAPSTEVAFAAVSASLASWFRDRYGAPTTAQRLAWPVLAAGHNLLLTAPTGSGKTLAAFAPILDRLLAEPTVSGVCCLYVAPLKALAADAAKNLTAGLASLSSAVRVGLRTGDTSAYLRRRQRLRPPHVLLTTPESLALLLTHEGAAALFAALRWVVVDELHAFVGNKRGADLTLSLERLHALARQAVQRIGLSATCSPVALAASFLVGVDRPCTVAQAADPAPLALEVEPLEVGDDGFLAAVVARLEGELRGQRTTLVFTNTRSLAERLTWALKRRFPGWADELAVHHSSLGAGRRRDVERRLKAGELRAVVSSTSLELGVDIGSVDGVVLIHPPGGAGRLMQRIGRAGHTPSRPRRGLILTTSPSELLEATVTAAAGRSGQWEPLRTLDRPLDVLCQHLLGMAVAGPVDAERAFALCRQAYPYRDLSRADFDDCLDYLTGRGRDGQPWLPPRLWRSGTELSILDRRTARIVRQNIGTISTDEPRPVCLVPGPNTEPRQSLRVVGQLDELFADGLLPGDRFLLDGRCLEFVRTDGRTLLVQEAGMSPTAPRWLGAGPPLAHELARRLYLLRSRAAETLRDGPTALADFLRTEYDLRDAAVADLVHFFHRQECVSEVPDTACCLIEAVVGEFGVDHHVHTPLNRAGNDALVRVAVRRLARRRRTAGSQAADLGFVLTVEGRPELTADDLRILLAAADFDSDLSEAVAGSELERERFRGAALTGLMLLRNPLGKRVRTGGTEWAARQLYDRVHAADPDFVLLRQARREVHEDLLDARAARSFAEELPRCVLRWRWLAGVSPLAAHWTQTAEGPTEAGESPAEALVRLHALLTTGIA